MIIKKKIAWWKRVEFANAYHVRAMPKGVVIDPTDQSTMEAIPFAVVAHTDSEEVETDMAAIALDINDGVYDVFVSAADKAGNESDPLEFRGVALDFTPPPAPTVGGFRS